MDVRTVLVKTITLIYRSRLIGNVENDDLIKTILNTMKTDTPEANFMGKNPVKNLKETAYSLLLETDQIPKDVLIAQVSVALENDPKLLSILKDSIAQDHDEPTNKRIITNLIKALNNFYKEHLAYEIFNKASYDMKFNRHKIGNFSEYLVNTINQLEPLSNLLTTLKDPAVIGEMDFENPDSVDTVFDQVKSLNSSDGVYRLGWQGVNRMTQGGLRRGECVGVEALQHKYKTGSTLSMFCQIATLNNPIQTKKEIEEGKKPLLVRVSFEDNLSNNLQFIYQYLKANEGNPVNVKDIANLSTAEVRDYVTAKLTATGFKIRMRRVDPTQWTYASLINYIIELEAEGYAVHMLMTDYNFKIPTTGCTQGAMGADKRDLVRRIRNFCSARNILHVSPYQLSGDAKQLLRNGVPDAQFLPQVANKGYTDSCKTIDQELDLEILVHLFTHNRKKYLAFHRGKHRLSTVVPEEDLYCMYQFPGINIPVLEDVNTDDTSMRKLPASSSMAESSLDSVLDNM